MEEATNQDNCILLNGKKCFLNAEKKINFRATFGDDLLLLDANEIIIPLNSNGEPESPLTPDHSYSLLWKKDLLEGMKPQSSEADDIKSRIQKLEEIVKDLERLKGENEAIKQSLSTQISALNKNESVLEQTEAEGEELIIKEQNPPVESKADSGPSRSTNASISMPNVPIRTPASPPDSSSTSTASTPSSSSSTTPSSSSAPTSGASTAATSSGTSSTPTSTNTPSASTASTSTATTPTQKAGYLEKKGANRRNWTLRWFVLKEGSISYYKRPEDKKPQGTVSLEKAKVVSTVKYDNGKARVEKPLYFGIVTPNRDFIMRAKDQTEKQEWIAAIRSCCSV